MKKLFIDTNIWLRFLLQDNDQAKACQNLIELIETGKFRVYASSIVMLELNYVLSSSYKIKPSQVVKDIKAILKTRNLVLIEETDFGKALNWHEKFKVKLADCLIGSQLPKGMILVSYDKDFKKLPVNLTTPENLLV